MTCNVAGRAVLKINYMEKDYVRSSKKNTDIFWTKIK